MTKTLAWMDMLHYSPTAAAVAMGVRTHVAERELERARRRARRLSEIAGAVDDFKRSQLGRECGTTNLYKLIANRADRFVPERA